MALRSLLLAAVVGVAALGTFHSPAAQAEGYLSISVGTPSPYYRGGYGHGHRGDVVWVPAHWVSTYRGRVLVPGRYVRVAGYGRGHGYGYGPGYGHGGYRGGPVYYGAPPIRPLPGAFYEQRGGRSYDAYYGRGGYRGW
ncbi:hypothetical protein ACFQZQ_04345 [Lysobacter koreensis]|uniref:Uncharacterized protein n=1 Tax=Lysobacter koreensis TaxID=266122 RepID=A0ABW2YNX8_9GAMM